LGKRTKAAAQMLVLGIVVGLLAWHTIYWHLNGTQEELFKAIGDSWWDTTKGVGYNLGLMAAAGILLGLLMEKFTDLVGYKISKIEHFASEEDSEASAAGKEAAPAIGKGEEPKASELVA